MKGKSKTGKGITLIALIITIVILLILAAVAINAITEYKIIENANSAAQKYGNQAEKEDETLGGYSSEIDKYLGGTSGGTGSEGSGENTGNVSGDLINKVDSYIGYYADIDADGDIDGIIYADLAVGKSGEWYNSEGAYSYEAKTNLNNYVVRDATEAEEGLFNGAIAKVIAPIGNRVEANNRFYVMALKDINPRTYYCWYADAYKQGMSDYEIVTSVEFGTGKVNTATMIGKWNEGLYGSKNTGDYADMWGVIQEEVSNGWFVPSRAEWSAFADAFSINDGNYSQYGLRIYYWSSSQNVADIAWSAYFIYGYMVGDFVDYFRYVRLGTTF